MLKLTPEMIEALEADGEKLRALTDEDHGPAFFGTRFICPECGGDGEWGEGPTNSCGPGGGPADPEYRRVICPECEGAGVLICEPIDRLDVQPPKDDIAF